MAIPNVCDWWLLGSKDPVLVKPILTERLQIQWAFSFVCPLFFLHSRCVEAMMISD